MFGVFVDYGKGEECVYKNASISLVMKKQAEYVKTAKRADNQGKPCNIVSCRFGQLSEDITAEDK